jgi:hypothetical protein
VAGLLLWVALRLLTGWLDNLDLHLTRVYETGIHTAGLLRLDQHIFTTLEDATHPVKIKEKTRIPPGTYDITLRTVSPMAERYRQRFGHDHEGMLWLQDVPNFDHVYIHIGNIADDSAGCILVGKTLTPGQGFIGESKNAYEELYPLIMGAIAHNERVTITIKEKFV